MMGAPPALCGWISLSIPHKAHARSYARLFCLQYASMESLEYIAGQSISEIIIENVTTLADS